MPVPDVHLKTHAVLANAIRGVLPSASVGVHWATSTDELFVGVRMPEERTECRFALDGDTPIEAMAHSAVRNAQRAAINEYGLEPMIVERELYAAAQARLSVLAGLTFERVQELAADAIEFYAWLTNQLRGS